MAVRDRIAKEGFPRSVFCQQNVRNIEIPFAESTFTPRQIEIPHFLETLVEPEPADLSEFLREAFPP